MLFNSAAFAVFFITVYALYLLLGHRKQNTMLLLASYVFYAAWDWRFLSLIWISTLIDYFCGIKIDESHNPKTRKHFLILSIATNLSLLGFFKYFDFFSQSLSLLMHRTGVPFDTGTLNIILPIGISFYTFQSMSYTIDIYRRQMKATRYLPDFALYVAFFPQLVAGPIERARNLLPQILKPRQLSLDQFYRGSYLIFFGLFQKMFVADQLAVIVEGVFKNPNATFPGAVIMLASYAFAFQIFCDFAGYSNIARGVARLMGFEIMVNFNVPYFSKNPAEFWKRWHISLSSWLRDYLYIPLGGNRGPRWKVFRNLSLTMVLGGLWHGASWTFVLWGAYHGALLVLYKWSEPLIAGFQQRLKFLPSVFGRVSAMIIFFHLVCFGWLIFRAQSLHQLGNMTHALFFSFPMPWPAFISTAQTILSPLWVLLIIQILQYKSRDVEIVLKLHPVFRTAIYYTCFYLLIIYGKSGGHEFIYFQF